MAAAGGGGKKGGFTLAIVGEQSDFKLGATPFSLILSGGQQIIIKKLYNVFKPAVFELSGGMQQVREDWKSSLET